MEIPTHKQALEALLKWVADQGNTHPDPAQRDKATAVLGDFFVATLLDVGRRSAPTGRESGEQ